MKTLLTILCILAIAAVSDAKEVFKDKDMKDLRVVAIQDGKATIQDKRGAKKEAGVNDHIGRGEGKIVEIEKTYITVETDTTRTRMPIVHGFERK